MVGETSNFVPSKRHATRLDHERLSHERIMQSKFVSTNTSRLQSVEAALMNKTENGLVVLTFAELDLFCEKMCMMAIEKYKTQEGENTRVDQETGSEPIKEYVDEKEAQKMLNIGHKSLWLYSTDYQLLPPPIKIKGKNAWKRIDVEQLSKYPTTRERKKAVSKGDICFSDNI